MPGGGEIRGNTLKVYLYLLRRGPSELRDVQRGVGLSTPSLASYHLGKLLEAGFVAQDPAGRYVTNKDSSSEILKGYSKIGVAIVPQLFFFTLLFTILVGFFSYESLYGGLPTAYLIAISAGIVAVLWYETARVWRELVV